MLVDWWVCFLNNVYMLCVTTLWQIEMKAKSNLEKNAYFNNPYGTLNSLWDHVGLKKNLKKDTE